MIEIKSQKIHNSEIIVPGSKSYTHRILISAALSDGICTIYNGLKSEDTLLTLGALRQMGINIHIKDDRFVVHGSKGMLKPCIDPVYLGNSGTSVRFLTAVAALGQGVYTLTGTRRMGERPIQDLLDGLVSMGVDARSVKANGCPPIEVKGGGIMGGGVALKCGVSSQFLSALLLIAPYTTQGIEINVVEGPVSRPYVDMTVDVMEELGVQVQRDGYQYFSVAGGQVYRAGSYEVEADCFAELLESMGCKIVQEADGITVSGRPLSSITADMSDMPDMVPTLAVVAAFAKGTSVIKNVGHLKDKESDRLGSVVKELSKIGIDASCSETGMEIKGGCPHGAEIDTYGDHRMAMSFALAGLKISGIVIRDERCVEKSFPDFWDVFESLYHR
ncbi:MAG: 3-phosphoshikimate 1-carboxyvinyltransferase [Deltaproteobacteria bacterium]|nr:3-phosphoshikimate 1-carboxyvinyltransferase [Deltaproteobacteria bacterium]